MKELKTEVNIEAPISKVWNSFYDFEKFGEWNTFIKQVKGPMKVGESIEIEIQPVGKKAMQFKPVLLKNENQKEFRWKGSLGGINGLFDGEHYFIFESIDRNTTRLIHGEKFSGILVWPILAQIGKATKMGFENMNKDLKRLCENL